MLLRELFFKGWMWRCNPKCLGSEVREMPGVREALRVGVGWGGNPSLM